MTQTINAATLIDPEVLDIAATAYEDVQDYPLAEGITRFDAIEVEFVEHMLILYVYGRNGIYPLWFPLNEEIIRRQVRVFSRPTFVRDMLYSKGQSRTTR